MGQIEEISYKTLAEDEYNEAITNQIMKELQGLIAGAGADQEGGRLPSGNSNFNVVLLSNKLGLQKKEMMILNGRDHTNFV